MAKSKHKGLRKAPAPLFWFHVIGTDGHRWNVYLTCHNLRDEVLRGERVYGLAKDKAICGITLRDRREVYVDAAWPDYETTALHEILHIVMQRSGFDRKSEEAIADLALPLQLVLSSIGDGLRLPPPPAGMARQQASARRKYQ